MPWSRSLRRSRCMSRPPIAARRSRARRGCRGRTPRRMRSCLAGRAHIRPCWCCPRRRRRCRWGSACSRPTRSGPSTCQAGKAGKQACRAWRQTSPLHRVYNLTPRRPVNTFQCRKAGRRNHRFARDRVNIAPCRTKYTLISPLLQESESMSLQSRICIRLE
jgi:hypothetical protein